MADRLIGNTLRKYRKQHGWSINDVVLRLQENYHLKVAEKTVYGWESDQAYPRTQTLLALCELYEINDISEELLNDPMDAEFPITREEVCLIQQYRQHPEFQEAVKRLLDF